MGVNRRTIYEYERRRSQIDEETLGDINYVFSDEIHGYDPVATRFALTKVLALK